VRQREDHPAWVAAGRSALCLSLPAWLGCGADSARGPQPPTQITISVEQPPREQPGPEVTVDHSALLDRGEEVAPAPPAPGEIGGVVQGAVGPAPSPSSRATQARPQGLKCDFPEDRKDGVSEGKVILRVKVDATGKPIDVQVLNDPGGFGQSASACVRAAKFLPGTDDAGAPAVSSVTIAVRYAQ